MPSPTPGAFADRPLRLVVPYPASGAAEIFGTPAMSRMLKLVQTLSTPALTDWLAQDVANGAAAALDQPVHVERRAGGMTIRGVTEVARATPDGYTLLFAGASTIAQLRTSGSVQQGELAAIALVAEMPVALVRNSASAAVSVRQLIEQGRLSRGVLNVATPGEATTAHLASAAFRLATAVPMVGVGYNGSSAALNAVATRNVEFGFVPLTAVLPFLGAGKLQLVALCADRRHPAVAEIPTIAESGVDGFHTSGWFGIFAPAQTPGSVVSMLNTTVNRVLAGDTLQGRLREHGLFAGAETADAFGRRVQRDRVRWSKLRGSIEDP